MWDSMDKEKGGFYPTLSTSAWEGVRWVSCVQALASLLLFLLLLFLENMRLSSSHVFVLLYCFLAFFLVTQESSEVGR
jgi:hypothetical protein